jgi:uncharacterized RDD family membrane protein YckC
LANWSSSSASPAPSLDPFAPPTASLEPTAAPAPGAHELADRFTRFGANLLDWILLAPFAGIGCAIAGALNSSFNFHGDEAKGVYFIFGMLLALPFQIYQWYAVSTRGQTLGKRFCRIRIVRIDGSPIGFTHAVLLRSWVPMGLIVLIGAIGLDPVARLVNFADTVSIFSGNRRMLHDLIAGTHVVNVTPTPPTARGA